MHWDTFVDAFVPAWLGAFLSAWGWSVDVRYCSSGRREGLVKTSQIYKNTTIKNQSRQFRNTRQNTWKNLWRNQFNQYIFFLLSLLKVLLSRIPKLLLTGHSAPYLLPKVMKWQKKNCLVFNEPLLFGIRGYLSSSTALSPPEVLSGLFCCCITGPGDWLAEVFPLL